MKKSELIDKISKDAGLTKAQATRALEATLENIGLCLGKGEPVKIVGFGVFSALSRKERFGTDPRTGKKMRLKALRVVKFKPGSTLKRLLAVPVDSKITTHENEKSVGGFS